MYTTWRRPRSYYQDKILAYHWKDDNKNAGNSCDSFRSLIKMKYEKNNFKTIGAYLIIIAVLSILFNLSSSFIYDGIKHRDHNQKENAGKTQGVGEQHK